MCQRNLKFWANIDTSLNFPAIQSCGFFFIQCLVKFFQYKKRFKVKHLNSGGGALNSRYIDEGSGTVTRALKADYKIESWKARPLPVFSWTNFSPTQRSTYNGAKECKGGELTDWIGLLFIALHQNENIDVIDLGHPRSEWKARISSSTFRNYGEFWLGQYKL